MTKKHFEYMATFVANESDLGSAIVLMRFALELGETFGKQFDRQRFITVTNKRRKDNNYPELNFK